MPRPTAGGYSSRSKPSRVGMSLQQPLAARVGAAAVEHQGARPAAAQRGAEVAADVGVLGLGEGDRLDAGWAAGNCAGRGRGRRAPERGRRLLSARARRTGRAGPRSRRRRRRGRGCRRRAGRRPGWGSRRRWRRAWARGAGPARRGPGGRGERGNAASASQARGSWERRRSFMGSVSAGDRSDLTTTPRADWRRVTCARAAVQSATCSPRAGARARPGSSAC